MRNDKLRFIVDSRCFNGSCVTTLSDGIHGDYHHETLEELKIREQNPHLIAVPESTLCKKMRTYLQSLCTPFSEITEERYYDYMEVLPPIRHTRNYFFLGEPYYGNVHQFCFQTDGRYFTGLRSVTTPRNELERQMENHFRNITFKGSIRTRKTIRLSDHVEGISIVSYLFTDRDGEEKFICNLTVETGNQPNIRDARRGTAQILRSLRRHHFLYFSANEGNDDMDRFLDRVIKERHTLLANGCFLQYPLNRESVSFAGTVKESGEEFFYRIYDKDLFLHLLHKLRSVKREIREQAV